MFRIHCWAARLGAAASFGLTLTSAIVATPAPVLAATRTEDGVEAAQASQVVPALALPGGTLRVTHKPDLDTLTGALRKVAAQEGHTIGTPEVLVWTRAGRVQTALPRSLEAAGYTYTSRAPVAASNGQITVFTCTGPAPRRDLLGMWIDLDGILMLSWAPVAPDGTDAAPAADAAPAEPEGKSLAAPASGAQVLEVAASAQTVNVMGRATPPLPPMPKIAARPGVVRGYVRDTHGRPLKGALIGVRATAVGGFYSGASAKTDATGYYEIKAPWGVADFYCAGYATDYGDGIAAFGLAPADGSKDEFATSNGAVKNWVLLPYGVADRAAAQDQPQYSGNYYGGTVVLNYHIDSDSQNTKDLPAGATIELTLTPAGPLLDGSRGRTIVVRRAVGTGFALPLYINNIPVGTYKIAARLAGGDPLRLRETGPYANRPFGLEPKEASGEATLRLKSEGADPNMATAARGHWQEMQITLERS